MTTAYRADTNADKVDLIVGVYRNDDGEAPVMAAVSAAEHRLWNRRESKAYRGLSGDADFLESLSELLLGSAPLRARSAAIQTVAGTGALRLLAEFIASSRPKPRLLLGTPAYANHVPVFAAAGVHVSTFRLVDDAGRVDENALFGAVAGAAPGDVLLIQGCCHNPTGTDLPLETWMRLGDALSRKGVVPLIDQAYFGLGAGLSEDLRGMKLLLERVPEALIAVSCSKAFSLYSERVGAAIVLGEPQAAAGAIGTLESIARAMYSQAPHHGAAIVSEILHDHNLRVLWETELDSMRRRLDTIRRDLLDSVATREHGLDLSVLRSHRGMFTTLPLSTRGMGDLRAAGFHGTESGRINLAGLPSSRVASFADALARASLLERRPVTGLVR